MDKVIMEDHYHMTTMDENMNWMKPTHMLSSCFSKVEGRMLYNTSTFAANFLKAIFECTHSRKIILLPYVYYVCQCLK